MLIFNSMGSRNQTHLEDKSLGMTIEDDLDQADWNGKTYPKYG